MARYAVKTRAESASLRKAAIAVEQSAWNALGFLNFTSAHFQFYEQLQEEHADCQLCLVDEETGYPVAVGSTVPVACNDIDTLPAEGWDWVVETAGSGACKKPNYLAGLGVSVPRVHRSKGLARLMIKAMGDLARARGYDGVVIPVRPTSKAKHPFVSIDEYVGWKDEQGRSYDPWFRSHLAAGGKMIRPCARSMVVDEPIAFWEAWTGQEFANDGDYAIEGGLAPVQIDRARGKGRYEEPNVWFAYAA